MYDGCLLFLLFAHYFKILIECKLHQLDHAAMKFKKPEFRYLQILLHFCALLLCHYNIKVTAFMCPYPPPITANQFLLCDKYGLFLIEILDSKQWK